MGGVQRRHGAQPLASRLHRLAQLGARLQGLGEALELAFVGQGRLERGDDLALEQLEVDQGLATVDMQALAAVVDLPGMAGRATQSHPLFALVRRRTGQADGQVVGVGRRRAGRSEAETAQVVRVTEACLAVGLFQCEKPGQRDDPRAEAGVPGCLALLVVPVLVQQFQAGCRSRACGCRFLVIAASEKQRCRQQY